MGARDEQINKLDENKVYTSYYSRACRILPDMRLISISLGIPDGFNGEIYRDLNPTPSLLSRYKKGLVTEEEYTKEYFDTVLNHLNPVEVYNRVKGKVMLCYCGKNAFCHRHLVLQWLADNLGSGIIGGEI